MKSILTPEEVAAIKTIAVRVKAKTATREDLGRYWNLQHEEFARTMRLLAKPDGTLTDSEIELLRRQAIVRGCLWYSLVNTDEGNWKAFDTEWLEKAKSGWPTRGDLADAYGNKVLQAVEQNKLKMTDAEVEQLANLVANSEKSEESLIALIGCFEYVKQESAKRIKEKEASTSPALEAIKSKITALIADKKNTEAGALVEETKKSFPFASDSQRAGFLIWFTGVYLERSNKAQKAYLEALQKTYAGMKKIRESKEKDARDKAARQKR